MSAEARLRELGLTLPPAPKAMGTYATTVRAGDTLYIAGHGPLVSSPLAAPLHAQGGYVVGRLGADMDVAAGREAARLTALAMLATIRSALGSLDRVAQIVKVLGLVQCTPEFGEHPQVINGFSDTMVDVFGEAGRAARSAFGAPALPMGIAVEIEAIVHVAGA